MLGDAVDVPLHLVVLTELDQSRDGVQLVVELVDVLPQCRRAGAADVEFALDLAQFGAVTERGHRGHLPSRRLDRHRVEDEDAISGEDELVAVVARVTQDVEDPVVESELLHPPAHTVLVEAEHVVCAATQQDHPTRRIQRHHGLLEALEHRLPLAHQVDDLPGLHSHGLPLDASGQQDRPDSAQNGGHGKVDDEVRGRLREALPHRRVLAADDRHTDDAAVGIEHRDL